MFIIFFSKISKNSISCAIDLILAHIGVLRKFMSIIYYGLTKQIYLIIYFYINFMFDQNNEQKEVFLKFSEFPEISRIYKN